MDSTSSVPPPHQKTKELRVLHVYKTWTPESYGGVEQFISTLCLETEKMGIKNRVLYLGKNKKPTLKGHDNIKGICFPLDIEVASTGFSFSMLKNFSRLEEWCDILHFHFPWPFGDLIHFLSRSSKPMIISYHSDIFKQRYLKIIYKPLMNYFLKKANIIVPASPNYVLSSPVLKKYKSKVEVIPYGLVDQVDHTPNPERVSYWRNQVGENFAFFMGVLRYYKGLHTLMEASRKVSGPIVIAGAGPMEKEIKDFAESHNLTNIKFVGRISEEDKDILYRLSRFFVFPSHVRSEAFGISLLEAAMHGKPMISCEIGTGTTFININGKTGVVIEPENVEMLSVAMNKLFEQSEEYLEYSKNARQRFEELFTAKKMASSYLELYRRISP
jgi:glycosyltransferase involved in cell wall biosynthesis